MKKLELKKIKITKLDKFTTQLIKGGSLVNGGTTGNSEQPPCKISEAVGGGICISEQRC